ncbi:MAG: ABC transporter ATP-binding protein [Tissierellia bacterium]|nr:ABC transporter ATP-binding protein [Tissierellia bacterium]
MKKIWKKEANLVFFTMISLVVYVAADIIMAMIFGGLVDSASRGSGPEFQRYILYTIALIVTYPFMYLIYNVLRNKMVYRLSTILKQRVFRSLMSKRFADFYSTDVGSKVSVLTNDIKIMERDYFKGIVSLVKSVILFLAAIISIFIISKVMALFLLTLSILSMVIPPLIGKKMNDYKRRVSDSESDYTARSNEFLMGYDTVRVFGIKHKVISFFAQKAEAVFGANMNYFKYYSKVQAFTIFLGSLTFMGSFIFGGYLVSKDIITLGSMIICIQLSNHVTQPIYSIVGDVNSIKSVSKVIEKLNTIMASSEVEDSGEDRIGNTSFRDSIELKDVEFSYVPDQPLLQHFNLSIEKGKKYAIVGRSGSGKSSIINLIAGRLYPTQGDVCIDNRSIHNEIGEDIIDIVSVIDQDIFLFKGTLRDNITLYNEKFTNQDVIQSLEMAGLSKFIDKVDDAQFVSEQGKSLSGGEKQRISIARALIKGSPILLADEIFSALDNETAYSVENQLLSLEGITLLSVTHRILPKNIEKYDEIIVIDKGQVVEKGSYEDLMEHGSWFREMISTPEIDEK